MDLDLDLDLDLDGNLSTIFNFGTFFLVPFMPIGDWDLDLDLDFSDIDLDF